MYETTLHRDYVKTESEYRLGRIRSDIVGRRRRRALTRRGEPGDTTFTTVR
jgi:hypothetical protein